MKGFTGRCGHFDGKYFLFMMTGTTDLIRVVSRRKENKNFRPIFTRIWWGSWWMRSDFPGI